MMARCISLVLLLVAICHGCSAELEAFAYRDEETARQRWEPQFGSRPVRVEVLDDGTTCLALDAEFAKAMGRACWDWVADLDLSQTARIAFDISASNPAVVGTVGIYFGTPHGWYARFWGDVWETWTLRVFDLSDFTTEGEPDGWDKVTRFRFSVWSSDAGQATLRLRGLRTLPADPTENFLRNGSFEIASVGIPYAWGSGHWGIGHLPWAADMHLWRRLWRVDRSEAKHGNNSLCIENAPGLPPLRAVSAWVSVPKRVSSMVLSAWLKSDQEKMPVTVECAGRSVSAEVGVDWQQVILGDVPRVDYLTVVVAPKGNGRVWLDAVQLQSAGEPTAEFHASTQDEAIALREQTVDWSPPARTSDIAQGRSISGPRPVESVRIDEHGRFLVNGEPYVMHALGLEFISDLAMLDLVAKLGFKDVCVEINRAVTTERLKEIMDRCAQVGLRVIPWLDGGIPRETFAAHIRTLAGHPALLCWYVYDEPSGEGFAEAEARYRLAKELDPARPALINYLSSKLEGHAGDIYSTDVYPIPHSTPSEAIGAVARMYGAAEPERKPVWMWLQGTGYAYWMAREPSPRELSCMVYGSFISGARGIYYFAQIPRTKECLEEMRALCVEVDTIAPVLYSLEQAPEVTCDVPAILYRAYRFEGQDWVLAVNTANARHTARLSCAEASGPVEVVFEARTVEAKDGGWKDEFGPYERRVYRVSR